MKIKRIRNEKELIAGNYIRAVINCHGLFWIEYVVLVGRPYNAKSKHMPGYRQIAGKKTSGQYYSPRDWYLSSLGEELDNVQSLRLVKNPFRTVLIKYSSKVWAGLKAIKTLREFAHITTGITVSDERYQAKLCEFEFQKYQDDEHMKALMEDRREEY